MTSANGQWISDSASYLRPQTGADAWTQEADARGGVGGQRLLGAELTQAPVYVAHALRLGLDASAIRRRRLITFNGRPVELVDSWYPPEVAADTQLAEFRKIKGGAVTLLAELGYRTASATEDVESRLAEPAESALLELGRGEPVLVQTRTVCTADGVPFEVCVMVTPGSERRLRYEMKVN
ncbi:GntR family transcriptional regulator [Kitasatospora sp. NPDC004745]|uniref:GntR family transcriptional regulator n=1 Tax=Kitasatospora sp. NPDC004745 TaxID=3364019 RepID=UPI003695C15B